MRLGIEPGIIAWLLSLVPREGGWGVPHLMTYTLYGEAAPERIGVSLVVVYKKVEKSVISVCEEAHKSYRCISWLCKSKSIV